MLASRGISKLVLLVGGAWVVLLITLIALERWMNIETPACLFKRATGFPCPTCGSTRAMESLLHGHIGAAISLNPLITVLVLLTPVALLVSRGTSAPTARSRMTPTRWNIVVGIGLAALALNWAWVIHRGN